MTARMPLWQKPPDIAQILADQGEWEDERWAPILLTALGGTLFKGREIALLWQLSILPSDPLLRGWAEVLEAAGRERDGWAWSEIVHRRIGTVRPDLLPHLHDDSESATCVVWVEAEADCRAVIEILWTSLRDPEPSLSKLD